LSTKGQRSRKAPPLSERLGGTVVLIAVLTIVGLAIADFADDGKVDQLWIGALLILALTFGGYGADRLLGRFFRP
jgi:hypothetical protein